MAVPGFELRFISGNRIVWKLWSGQDAGGGGRVFYRFLNSDC